MRNLLLSSVLLVASVLFAALVGEIGVRLLGHSGAPESLIGNIRYVDDPILDWRFVSNSTVQDGNIIFRYNSAGFRDVEHAVEKPIGVTRLVVVGDSVTEGYGVGQDAMFSRRVQDLLGSKFEIINLGMSGLNTPQEVHLLEVEGVKYKPDIVVLNFVLNDCDFFSELYAAERFYKEQDARIGLLGNITIAPRFKRLLKSSALIYLLKARLEHLIGSIIGKEEKNYYAALWGNPECRKRVMAGLDDLQRLQQQHRFVVHVLIWPLLVEYASYDFSHIHGWVKENAEKRGFKVLDLRTVYSARRYRDLQVTAEDNVHPNGEGHQVTAQAYVEWSREFLNAGPPISRSQ